MKMNDNQIDDLFKDAFANQRFDYDHAFFAEVEGKLLPQKERKLVGIWVILVALFCFGIYLPFHHEVRNSNNTMAAKTYDWNRLGQNQRMLSDRKDLKTIAQGRKLDLNRAKEGPFSNMTSQSVNYGPSKIKSSATTQLNEEINYSGKTQTQFNNRSNIYATTGLRTIQTEDKKAIYSENRTDIISTKMNGEVAISESSDILAKEELDFRLNLSVLRKLDTKTYSFQPSSYRNYANKRSKGMFITISGAMGRTTILDQPFLTKSASLGAGYAIQKGYWGISAAFLGQIHQTRLNFTEATKHFGYGVTHYENQLNYSSLYFAELPVWLHFKKGIHGLHTGLMISHLVQSKLDYTYKENGVAKREETLYGQKEGLNPTLLTFQMGYGIQLTKRLIFGTNFSYTFNSMTKNIRGNQTQVSPFGGQVYLRHSIKR